MENRIQVDFAVLRATAQEIDTLAEDYKNKYTELKAKVDNLVDGQIWVSDDSQAFRAKVDDFTTTDFQKMYNEMVEYSQHLKNSADNYDNAQQQNLARAQGMKSHYNG